MLNINDTLVVQLDVEQLQYTAGLSFCMTFIVLIVVFGINKKWVERLRHRQLIARMFLENGWYEREEHSSKGYFTDLKMFNQKRRITYFPKVYYMVKDNKIHVRVAVSMGKYQDSLISLENKLEVGLFCNLIKKTVEAPYIHYVFYDMLDNRISIDDVTVKDGKMKLMQDIYWYYDKFPHMLISGDTGSGKSYSLLTIIKALVQSNANVYVIDPKNSALADLSNVLPYAYNMSSDIVNCIKRFCDGMMKRNSEMKEMPGYRTGGNYASLGLQPHFLVFDEYVAFIDMLDKKEKDSVLKMLSQIAMLGRESGYFLILACQRPDSKYFGDGIRDQFHFRLALGLMSDDGYKMMFGSCDKSFIRKDIDGRGYLNSGLGVITEFYSPIVPKGYDFIGEIGKHVKSDKKELESAPEVDVIPVA